MSESAYEVDPFVKRVVTVKAEDVVIFRFPTAITREQAEDYRTQIEAKMGSIPFLVIGSDIDLTVLKQASTRQVHIA